MIRDGKFHWGFPLFRKQAKPEEKEYFLRKSKQRNVIPNQKKSINQDHESGKCSTLRKKYSF
ncbi:MAG: hypothetical protein C4527_02035 [Candidatus Omnitrophota bacterium]|nr:MAG: hypothetical protein C4527_02035 [Candidatus Omnitrophota bacterium]